MGLCLSKPTNRHEGCSLEAVAGGLQAAPNASTNHGAKDGAQAPVPAAGQPQASSKLGGACQPPSSLNGDRVGCMRHGVILVASGAQDFQDVQDVRVETLRSGPYPSPSKDSLQGVFQHVQLQEATFLEQGTCPHACSSTSTCEAPADEQVISCCGSGASPSTDIMFDLVALELGAQGLPHDVAKYGAPRAPNEEARMQTINMLRHMGVDSCLELDHLLKCICTVWGAPVSSVTLLDSEHVWMCNAMGCGTGHRPWAVAMCPWTLLTPHPEALAVGDLELDARFHGNVHHQSGTRSYLTAPLVASNGHRLGAICFVDETPRTFTASDCRLMSNFAELAVRELEKHVGLADRLKQVEEAHLSQVYKQRVRDVDEVADTCVMLVDTRVEGWRLLYASQTWRDWTGVSREECVGRTLAELLEHVHGDPADGGVIWQGLVRNARESKPFVTPKVRVRESVGSPEPDPSTGRPALHHSFYLSFKAAGVDPLDADTVAVGVPAWVPMETTSDMAPLYFARLYTVPNPPSNTRCNTGAVNSVSRTSLAAPLGSGMLPSTNSMGLVGGGLGGGGVSGLLGCVASRLEHMSPALAATQLFRGLKPSHVLGQGAFGTVWYALWHGTPVALKVVDSEVHDDEERARCVAEVQLSASLTHVNIVRTLAHATSLMDSPGGGVGGGLGTRDCPSRSQGAYLSGNSATSANWLSGTDGKEVCVVPCLGGLTLPGVAEAETGPGSAPAGSSKQHAAAAATAVSSGASPPSLSMPQWPSPAKNATTLTSPANVCSHSPVLPNTPPAGLRGLKPAASFGTLQSGAAGRGAGQRAAAAAAVAALAALGEPHTSTSPQSPMQHQPPGLERNSVQPQSLDEADLQQARTAEDDITATLPVMMSSSHVGHTSGGPRRSPLPAYVGPMWHALGGMELSNSSNHADASNGVSEPTAGEVVAALQATAAAASSSHAHARCSHQHKGSRAQQAQPQPQQPQQHLTLDPQPSQPCDCDWDFPVVAPRRVDSETSQLGRRTHSGSGMMSLMMLGRGSHTPTAGGARAAAHATATGQQRISFDTTASESSVGVCGVGPLGTLRRYSSGGFNQRWRRSADYGSHTDQSPTIHPYSFRQWVLLEFCDRGSLGSAIDAGHFRVAPHPAAPPDLPRLAATALDVARGLVYLHGKGVVHGDLTAVNVLLQAASATDLMPGDGRGFLAKLSDFGMSVKLDAAQESVVVASYGAMTHMAPEVLAERRVGYKADVYSLGVIMWQMMTGSRPWAGLSHLQVTIAVGHEHRQLQWPRWGAPPPSTDPASATSMAYWGPQLAELGRACCDPDPDARPSAETVANKLQAICAAMLPAAARQGGLVGVAPLQFGELCTPPTRGVCALEPQGDMGEGEGSHDAAGEGGGGCSVEPPKRGLPGAAGTVVSGGSGASGGSAGTAGQAGSCNSTSTIISQAGITLRISLKPAQP